jgi:alpha,alpha-trehalase
MLLLLTLFTFFLASVLYPQNESFRISVKSTLDSLVYEEDTDNDKKITINDQHITGSRRGDKRFWINAADQRLEVNGTYFLSNLLQELKLAEEGGNDSILLNPVKIFEPPVDRISRMIADYYWDGLTRKIDKEGLLKILDDDKTKTVDGFSYLYIPLQITWHTTIIHDCRN